MIASPSHNRNRVVVSFSLLGLLILPASLWAFCLEDLVEHRATEIALLPAQRDFELPGVDEEGRRRAKALGRIDELTKRIEGGGKTAGPLAERAGLYLELGQEDRAAKDYAAAIELEPKNVDYRDQRAALNRRLGKHDLVESDLTELIELDKTAQRYLDRGNFYVDRWEPKKAVPDFTAAIKLDPELAEAYAKRGHVLFVEAGYDIRYNRRVQDDLEKAYQLDSNQPQVRRYLISIYMALTRYDDAAKLSSEILDEYPEDDCVRHYRSRAYRMGKRFDLALADANKVLESSPNASKHIVERAFIYRDMQEIDKAIEDFERAVVVNSDNHATYGHFGKFLLEQKRFEYAIKQYEKAIERNEFNRGVQGEYYAEMAAANFWLRNLEESEKNFLSASEFDPQKLAYKLDRGDVLCQMRRFDEALLLYEKAIEEHPNNVGPFERRARVYIVQGEMEKALEDLNRYLSTVTSSAEAYRLRAVVWKRLGNEEEMNADIERAKQAWQRHEKAMAEYRNQNG